MAVYSKLLLSTGGGIISTPQQAQQAQNTATVLIGLGGTGVDCIRTIKTQVYARLLPDDKNAVIPTYSHIRFLGVDTTMESKGDIIRENHAEKQHQANSLAALDDGEFFSIANQKVAQAFSSHAALEMKSEITWLNYENIAAPNLADAGAGGIRQVGRYMLMAKSQKFLNQVQQEIEKAKQGLVSPRVNVHIFAGLSGGTGSGCFLDVCYLVRSIIRRIGGTIFGYCFLPDVNLSRIPYDNQATRSYIRENGYAAMKELDYCMSIQQNGGAFEQEYQGHQVISWDSAPVDMCHLICATDADNNVLENAYDYAMNVTAEYIMDFLTQSNSFDLTQHLSNFRAMIAQADNRKVIGAKMDYCVIGASCASIPLREINTYLASELFDRFSRIGGNTPSRADVEKLAVSALSQHAQSIADIYGALLDEVRDKANNEYVSYPDDWKFVRDYGNSELILHYTNQTAAKVNCAEAAAQSMCSPENADSLLGRVRRELSAILRDIDRGPVYAHRALSAAQSHNLLNIIDGLQKENTTRMNEEAEQSRFRVEDYENAKADFDNRRRRSLLDNDEKRFNDYEYYLQLLEQHKLAMRIYGSMSNVLTTFRAQVVSITASYYLKLRRVMETLLNTFTENRNALQSERSLRMKKAFDIPMMTIEELKPALDEEIGRMDIPGMMSTFMEVLIDPENEPAWLSEDAGKITRLVTDFFVKTAFYNFAERSITNFLKDKYEVTYGPITDEQLANLIYEDWMKLLTGKASPLFHFDSSVWTEDQTSKLAFLSFPTISSPIRTAAERMHNTNPLWGLKESELRDRIFVMCSACGLPLSAYNNCTEYEKDYYRSKAVGRHYYEGKKIPGMALDDWNLLPSITPQSLINADKQPSFDLNKAVAQARALYRQARAAGLIDDDSFICEPDPAALDELGQKCARCENLLQTLEKVSDIPVLKEALDELDISRLPVRRTRFAMPADGYRKDEEAIDTIRKDHFVSSPVFHILVRDSLRTIETLNGRIEAVRHQTEQRVQEIMESSGDVKDYCDAVFVGVISLDGFNIVYYRDENIVMNDVFLSKRASEFPFGRLPLYQGFVSFRALSAELKDEIKGKVEALYETNSPQIRETGRRLLSDGLSDKHIQAVAQIAQTMPEKKVICEFLEELKQAFHNFCLENSL